MVHKVLLRVRPSHEHIGPSVRQPEPHQPAADQHGGRHQDGDGLGDADQRAEDQVSQHRRQLAHGVAEAKARSPGNEEARRQGEVVSVLQELSFEGVNCPRINCSAAEVRSDFSII